MTVFLDVDTPELEGLIIRGQLIFQGNISDLILSANWIYVEGPDGLLQVGSATDPRMTAGAIHLLNDPNVPIDPASHFPVGTDAGIISALEDHGLLIVDGGKLHLFGAPRSHSWLELQSTAAKDASTCVVNPNGGSLDWVAGDRVVLASTDFDWTQAEEFELTAVNGSTLTLSGALQNEHFGSMVYATGKSGNASWGVPEFGEVGLLNRNVVVTTRLKSGANWIEGDGTFGHVMLMRTGLGSTAPVGQFQWTELHHLGISNALGRYPIHYHYGDAQNPTQSTNSFVKFSSLHDCFHRWITLHNQRDIVLEGNVGYLTEGHGYYMEEYGTRECTVLDNLGIGTKENEAEPFPATFWFENPKLLVQGNHAAGSDGSGMWLEPQLGESWQHSNPAVSCFCDNVAHSNETWGIIQDAKPEAFYNLASDPPAFSGLVAWKNRRHGIWIRSLGRIRVSGCKMADNRAGMYPASEGLQTAGPFQAGPPPGTALIRVDDCLFLGETANKGKYPGINQGGAGTYHEERAALPAAEGPEFRRARRRLGYPCWSGDIRRPDRAQGLPLRQLRGSDHAQSAVGHDDGGPQVGRDHASGLRLQLRRAVPE